MSVLYYTGRNTSVIIHQGYPLPGTDYSSSMYAVAQRLFVLGWRGCAELDVLFFKLTQDPSPHLGREGPLVGWLGLARDDKANRRCVEVTKDIEVRWFDYLVLPFFPHQKFPHRSD